MHDRIKTIRCKLCLTQKKFAEQIGIAQNTLACYEMGRRKPSNAIILLICTEFNINEEWLRYGTGEMFNYSEKINNRITYLRKKLKLSMNEFGSRLGITKTSISRIESGKNNISKPIFKSICREYNVNEEWLRYGTGEIFNINVNLTSENSDDCDNDDNEFKLKIINKICSLDHKDCDALRMIFSIFKKTFNDTYK